MRLAEDGYLRSSTRVMGTSSFDDCLDEQTLLAFGRGQIAPEKRRPIEKHIAACDECRALVSAVARSSFVDPQELMGGPPSEVTKAAEVAPAEASTLAKPKVEDVPPKARAAIAGGARDGDRAAPGAPLGISPGKTPLRAPIVQATTPRRGFDTRIAIGILVALALLLAIGALINARRGF